MRLLDATQWQGKFFNGDWIDGASSQDIVEPATGESLTTVGWASLAQTAESARSAHAAQRKWASMPYLQRADVFRRAAALLEANRREVIDWIVRETGAIAPFAEPRLTAPTSSCTRRPRCSPTVTA
nr:aldehyde dehydrogenase family protein [Caballeronia sp. NCTM1]